MSQVRQPIVAGTFYPANPRKLRSDIEQYLAAVDDRKIISEDILGAVAPHAGYVFSGQCAAYSYRSLMNKDFDLAVIIAPSHQYGDFYYSLGNYDSYETPLGSIDVAQDYATQLLADGKFVFYPYAHSREHSLEVQLPFLQVIKPKAKILPILIGYQYDKSSEYLAGKLTSLFSARMDKTVFIVSSDLSHYHSSTEAEEMDGSIVDAVEKLDAEMLWEAIRNKNSEACGFGGILTIIQMAHKLKYDQVSTLCYTHSGETGGDNSQVVGYLSTLFYR